MSACRAVVAPVCLDFGVGRVRAPPKGEIGRVPPNRGGFRKQANSGGKGADLLRFRPSVPGWKYVQDKERWSQATPSRPQSPAVRVFFGTTLGGR